MKRTGAIACLTMLIVMMTAAFSFSFAAEDFHITRTYPADGEKNTTKDNMCVKLYFSSEVGNDASKAANKHAFALTTKKGKKIPSLIYYNKKNPKYAIVVVDTNKVDTTKAIKDDTEYVCTLSEGFVDNKGNKLGDDPKRVISFRTMNQGRNTIVYMVMMFVMFGGMMLFTVRQTAKQKMEEEMGKAKEGKEEAFNPYKEAKKTGKSVEEVIAKHEKEVAKKEAAKKAKAKRDKELDEYFEESDNYRVSKPLRIADAGATYKTGRAKLAEERKAEEARLKAERKATNYGKNPKGKKK